MKGSVNVSHRYKMEEIKFSAIVVTFNEERRLCECLGSLKFCDQILVIDLGSSDSSVNIAMELGAQVLHIKRMPIVEQIHAKVINHARNDWVILLDPDEVLSVGIKSIIEAHISNTPALGLIKIPSQFYFRGKRLSSTIWGGENQTKPVVLNRFRSNFPGLVHCGPTLLDGFSSVTLKWDENSYIKHFWIDSYKQLFEKHWRYIIKEGEARYLKGERYSFASLLNSMKVALTHNIITCNGYRSITGIFLSFFYAWYVLMSLLSLKKYQNNRP
jgi:glycosyltransferase involved in cell wall biosynthesis